MHPRLRLVLGEIGSGKTRAACRSILDAHARLSHSMLPDVRPVVLPLCYTEENARRLQAMVDDASGLGELHAFVRPVQTISRFLYNEFQSEFDTQRPLSSGTEISGLVDSNFDLFVPYLPDSFRRTMEDSQMSRRVATSHLMRYLDVQESIQLYPKDPLVEVFRDLRRNNQCCTFHDVVCSVFNRWSSSSQRFPHVHVIIDELESIPITWFEALFQLLQRVETIEAFGDVFQDVFLFSQYFSRRYENFRLLLDSDVLESTSIEYLPRSNSEKTLLHGWSSPLTQTGISIPMNSEFEYLLHRSYSMTDVLPFIFPEFEHIRPYPVSKDDLSSESVSVSFPKIVALQSQDLDSTLLAIEKELASIFSVETIRRLGSIPRVAIVSRTNRQVNYIAEKLSDRFGRPVSVGDRNMSATASSHHRELWEMPEVSPLVALVHHVLIPAELAPLYRLLTLCFGFSESEIGDICRKFTASSHTKMLESKLEFDVMSGNTFSASNHASLSSTESSRISNSSLYACFLSASEISSISDEEKILLQRIRKAVKEIHSYHDMFRKNGNLVDVCQSFLLHNEIYKNEYQSCLDASDTHENYNVDQFLRYLASVDQNQSHVEFSRSLRLGNFFRPGNLDLPRPREDSARPLTSFFAEFPPSNSVHPNDNMSDPQIASSLPLPFLSSHFRTLRYGSDSGYPVVIETLHKCRGETFDFLFVPEPRDLGSRDPLLSELRILDVPFDEKAAQDNEYLLWTTTLARVRFASYIIVENRRPTQWPAAIQQLLLHTLQTPRVSQLPSLLPVCMPSDGSVDKSLSAKSNRATLESAPRSMENLFQLSYSRIRMLQHCPKQFYYSYVLGLPQQQTPAMILGGILHDTIAAFQIKRDIEGVLISEEEMLQIYETCWEKAIPSTMRQSPLLASYVMSGEMYSSSKKHSSSEQDVESAEQNDPDLSSVPIRFRSRNRRPKQYSSSTETRSERNRHPSFGLVSEIIRSHHRGEQIIRDFYSRKISPFASMNESPGFRNDDIHIEKSFILPMEAKNRRGKKSNDSLSDSFFFTGVWDRIVLSSDGVSEVIEYKTSLSPATMRRSFLHADNLQLHLYAYACWLSRGSLPESIQLESIQTGETVTYHPRHISELEKQEFLSSVESILGESMNRIQRHEFEPRPNRYSCRMCSFKNICPSSVARSQY